VEHGVATAADDYENGNAHHDRLIEDLGSLHQRDAESDHALLELLHDENPSMRA
jgi:hypothetical protein